MGEFLIFFAGGAYLFMQGLALWNFDGGWRTALVPAVAMGAALGFAVLGGGSMAPLWVLILLGPCLLWMCGLMVAWSMSAQARAG